MVLDANTYCWIRPSGTTPASRCTIHRWATGVSPTKAGERLSGITLAGCRPKWLCRYRTQLSKYIVPILVGLYER